MTYRYRPPTLPPEQLRKDEAAATNAEPTEVAARRATMLDRYAHMFREAWASCEYTPAGIWPRIQELAPTVARSLDDSEHYADDMALAYVQGLVGLQDFERALDAHRAAWVRSAQIVKRATPPFPEKEPCATCGSTRFAIALRDDLGNLCCQACLAGATTSENDR